MYNDYYLEQINNKLQITNSKLLDLEENQEAIKGLITQQISGDIEIKQIQQTNLNIEVGILCGITAAIITNWICGMLKAG